MRFTDEKKWSDKWFRSLRPCHKIVWIYICDSCDIAGFYEVDIESISFHTKLTEDESKAAIEGLSRGYLGADGYIWIKNFLKHQNNHLLNPSNNCHKGIIKRIEMNLSLFPSIPEILGADKGLFSPTSKSKSKGNSNCKGKSNVIFTPPLMDDVRNYCLERKNGVDPSAWMNHYQSKGWMIGKNKMKDWKAAVRTWEDSKESTFKRMT